MLKYLLGPTSVETFVNDYWDKYPLVVQRNSNDYYKDILTIEQVNEYLSKNDIRFPSINIAKEGSIVPLSEYSEIISIGKYASEGLIDTDKLFDKFNNGTSIFLQKMRSSIDTLASFVAQLERELKFRIETHIFLTPDNSQALSEHYDTTSSFIMQVYGSKTWIVSKPILELPTIEQLFNNNTYRGSEKLFEVTLQQGDLLFLPRGVIHQAKTSSEMSMHITSVLYPITWLDIFTTMVDELKNNREFRKSSVNSDIKFSLLKEKVKKITNYKSIFQSLTEVTTERQVKDNSDRVFDYLNISKINISSKLARRKNINFEIIETDKTASLKFYDKKIDFPNFVFEILNYIKEYEEFSINDISSKLDDKGKLVLSRKLIKEGFLKIISV